MTATWTEPKYPGDAVRIALLIRGDELGDVRIMDYGQSSKNRYRIAAFLPGYEECTPGDTPKTWPEEDRWCTETGTATITFDQYVKAAHAAGWQDYNRETGKAA